MIDEKVYGTIVSLGAHLSLVKYTHGSIDFEVFVENDEFITVEDLIDNNGE